MSDDSFGQSRAAPWAGEASGRENNFDFLRFLLAVLVIFSHSFSLLDGHDLREPLYAVSRQFPFGTLAVNGFFIISGFLITMSYLRSKGTLDYLRKRALRIYPGFIVAMLITALVVAPIGADPGAPVFTLKQMGKLAWQTFTLTSYTCPGVFTELPLDGIINGSLWTIRYEFVCYIIVAMLAIAGILAHRRMVLSIFLGCMVLAMGISFLGREKPFEPDHPVMIVAKKLDVWPRFVAYYLAGVLFFQYRERIPFSHRLGALSLMAVGLSLWAPYGLSLSLPIFGTYLIFYLAYTPLLPLHRFGKYGDFSYGIYLYAFAIQQLLVMRYGERLTPLTLFLAATGLSVIAGALSWHLIEKHFLKLKRSKPGGERDAKAEERRAEAELEGPVLPVAPA